MKILLWFLLVSLPVQGAETDAELLTRVKAVVKGKGDLIQREVERIGDKTLKVESFLSMEADYTWFSKIAADVNGFCGWLIKNINNKPDGGTYMVKVMNLQPNLERKDALTVDMKLDFPGLRKLISRPLYFAPDVKPTRVRIEAEMPAGADSYISSGSATLTFFPAEGEPTRVWGYIDGRVKIRNWIIYEALPTRILKREASERFQTVIDNYQAEEIRRIKLNQSPTEKKAARGD